MLRQAGSVTAMTLVFLLVPVATITGTAGLATAEMEPRDPSVEAPDTAELGKPPILYRDELEQPDTLGVGRVARNVSEHLPALDAMASWLGSRIGGLGYARARPVVARDNAEMIEFLRRGIVDVVSETPLSAIHFVKAAGATILLRESRGGRATYDSVVFVRKDSPIHTLADLGSHRVAFEDSGSTTAFLLPLAGIKRTGLATVALATPMQASPKDAVGYFFALSETAILAAVARDVADAGALSSEEWKAAEDQQPKTVSGLRVIYESNEVPRAFLLSGPSVSAEQRAGLGKLLLQMIGDADGRETLDRYDKVDGLSVIDAATERSIADLEETWSLVHTELTGSAKGAN